VDDAMVTAAIVGAFLLGLAAGVGITVYFGRMGVRHARSLAHGAAAASLRTIADGIGEDTDPRRIAATLRLKAEQWQRSADALRPTTKEK
jgi:hypothetical protein